MQAIGNERQRAKQAAADDLGRHHCAAQPDDRPRLAGVTVVSRAEEHVAVLKGAKREIAVGHMPSFEIAMDDSDQLIGGVHVQSLRVLIRIDQVRADVVFDDLG